MSIDKTHPSSPLACLSLASSSSSVEKPHSSSLHDSPRETPSIPDDQGDKEPPGDPSKTKEKEKEERSSFTRKGFHKSRGGVCCSSSSNDYPIHDADGEGEREEEKAKKRCKRGGEQLARAEQEETEEDKIDTLSDGAYEVYVHSPEMKFSCAHFVAYEGFRESLHGHNYNVSIRMGGALGSDGYVLDFGDIKKKGREICKALNHSFLVPMKSDVLDITLKDSSLHITCRQDGSEFLFPASDCKCLPLVHSTVEEICRYIWEKIVLDEKKDLSLSTLKHRGIRWVEVSVSETPHQSATFRKAL